MLITSPANTLIKEAAALLQKKYRDKQQAFLLEGEKNLLAALENGFIPLKIFFAPEATSRYTTEFLTDFARKKEFPLIAVADPLIKKIADTTSPQPIIAVFPKFSFPFDRLALTKESFILVLDGLKDPGNLGTIIRTADAIGIDAVIITDDCADLFSPKTLRASMGSVFHIPVIENSHAEILTCLNNHAFRIFVGTVDARTNLCQADFSGRTAVVLGNEAHGVGRFFSEAADTTVSIPMQGKAESFNVAVAAALFLYEARGRK